MDIIGWLVVTQTGVIISPLRRETRASLEIMAEWLRHSDPDRDLHILAEWLRRSDPDRDLHTYYFPAPSQFSDFPLLLFSCLVSKVIVCHAVIS